MTPIALFDWDGTVREGFTLFPWVDYLAAQGAVRKECAIALGRLLQDYSLGVVSHNALAAKSASIYAESLKGSNCDEVEEHALAFHSQDKSALLPQAVKLLRFLERRRVAITVVSGAPEEVLAKFVQDFSIAAIYALTLERENRTYTGGILANPGPAGGKQKVIDAMSENERSSILLAVGNSESDAPLFEGAKLRLVMHNPRLQPGHRCIAISPETKMDTVFAQIDEQM